MSEAGAGQDKAPPGGGSQEDGGWKPPSDGSWLPKVRVDEMVGKEREATQRAAEEAARWKAEAEAAKAAGAKKDDARPITRTELKNQVDEGRLTQDQADTIWERQLQDTAKREAREVAQNEVRGQRQEQVVDTELGEYRKLMPDAWKVGTEERAKVEAEYRHLVTIGFPDSRSTELAAARAAFGSVDAIKTAKSTGKPGPGETHVETGGGERPGANAGDPEGMPQGLTAREKAYYTDKINRGIYKGWSAVTEERKFAKAKA